MDLGLVKTLASFVHERQRFCEHHEACLWLSYGPIGLGEERQKIWPQYLCSCGTKGYQALMDLLDPLLGLSLVRQRPAVQDRTVRPPVRKSRFRGEAGDSLGAL